MIHVPKDTLANLQAIGASGHRHFHRHVHDYRLSRRQFLKGSAALVGGTAASGLLSRVALAGKPGSGVPTQLDSYSPILQSATTLQIPFWLPIEIDPFEGTIESSGDPSTFINFNGNIGVVEADGVCDNNSEGVDRRWAADIRYMAGVYRDRHGRAQRGAFGFF